MVALPIIMATREGNPVLNKTILAIAGTDSSCRVRHVHGAQFSHNKDLSHRARPDKEIPINQTRRTAIPQAGSKCTGSLVSRIGELSSKL